MKLRILALALLVSGLGTGSAGAASDVPAMVKASDLIVVGRTGSVDVRSESSAPSQTFFVAVDRVLKGSGRNPPRQLQVRLDLSQPGLDAMPERRYGIFFLHKAQPGGAYTVVDPYVPALVASPARAQAAASSTAALDAVTEELLRVLATPAATLTDPLNGVEKFAGSATKEVQDILYRAAAAIETIPYETAGGGLRRIAASGPMPGRLWAMKCLFAMRGPPELETFKARHLDSIKSLLIDPTPDLAFTVEVLAYTIQGGLRSPKAVPTLVELLGSSEVTVRRAAASILSDIASDAVIAPLANVALKDADQNVRYYAVNGLAAASGGEVPTISAFKRSEAEMLGFWTGWARANVK